MNIKVSFDPSDGQILAVYLMLKSGAVSKTVEVAPDQCYADEGRDGSLIGFEMICPGRLDIKLIQRVARKYKVADMTKAVRNMENMFATA